MESENYYKWDTQPDIVDLLAEIDRLQEEADRVYVKTVISTPEELHAYIAARKEGSQE